MSRKKKRTALVIAQNSIVLDLSPILMARNIRTPYTFLTRIGINTMTAQKMLRGESIQLNYNHLTALCLHLNCTPNDLFARRDMELAEGHALHALPIYTSSPTKTIDEWLATKTVQEIEEMMKGQEFFISLGNNMFTHENTATAT